MFDTSEVWARVLKSLRDNNESVLMAACSDLPDIEFTSDYIVITTHNQSVYSILKKHLGTLQKYAGGDYIQLQLAIKEITPRDVLDKLQQLFGEKLTIE